MGYPFFTAFAPKVDWQKKMTIERRCDSKPEYGRQKVTYNAPLKAYAYINAGNTQLRPPDDARVEGISDRLMPMTCKSESKLDQI